MTLKWLGDYEWLYAAPDCIGTESLSCSNLIKKSRVRETLNINRLWFIVSQPVTYQTHVGVTTNQIPSEAGAKRDQEEAMKETDLAVSSTVITCDLDPYLQTTISCSFQKVVNKQLIRSSTLLSRML